jgi:Asp-tRNA(Asn)/Glu-tRNA(Gln) amidotransferase A subunit family amidase
MIQCIHGRLFRTSRARVCITASLLFRVACVNVEIHLDPGRSESLIVTVNSDGLSLVHSGAPLSALDGVLVAVKDEIDCAPYPTTGGTRWLGAARRCEADAACVAQLRACGAVLAGKANMHELGAGTSGINPHHGYVHTPYRIRIYTCPPYTYMYART